jgi:hypothetical protein
MANGISKSKFSSCLKENTTRQNYKEQLVDGVQVTSGVQGLNSELTFLSQI